MFRAILVILLAFLGWISHSHANDQKNIQILYVKQRIERPPVLSNLVDVPVDKGLAGARLAIKDSNVTGQFTFHDFSLREEVFNSREAPEEIIELLKVAKERLIILDLPATTLEKILKIELGADRLLFNVGASDNHFRTELCRGNILHTLPSRSMLSDALTQYLVKKRWSKWFFIEGPQLGDSQFAKAMRQSATKFGAKIIKQIYWDGGRDARRTAQAEVPRLTQDVNYDVLVVADEWGDFGEYLMYRTAEPRPVAGTQGLFPTAWYWTIEQWGAAQLQDRFFKLTSRRMIAGDYAAWVAVRSIGEAATRTQSVNPVTISNFIQSSEFELAGYKGRKLSYRAWSGQLRQPIAITAAHSLVTQSPQEGYLHQRNELDTLGFDKSEVICKRN